MSKPIDIAGAFDQAVLLILVEAKFPLTTFSITQEIARRYAPLAPSSSHYAKEQVEDAVLRLKNRGRLLVTKLPMSQVRNDYELEAYQLSPLERLALESD